RSESSRTTAGIVVRPAACAARKRRSPATTSYPPSTGRTTTGCRTPRSAIEAVSSAIAASSNFLRGCKAEALSWAVGTCCAPFSTRGSNASRPRPRPLGLADTIDHLFCQALVGQGSLRRRCVIQDRLAVGWCLRQPDGPRYHASEHEL